MFHTKKERIKTNIKAPIFIDLEDFKRNMKKPIKLATSKVKSVVRRFKSTWKDILDKCFYEKSNSLSIYYQLTIRVLKKVPTSSASPAENGQVTSTKAYIPLDLIHYEDRNHKECGSHINYH
jgi:hypothetical protein